ncbi:MAG: hypothetical protein ACFFCF_07880 [Promethearchaeota archaeon]
MSDDLKHVSVISFDFKHQKGVSQSRKTRFFRELYGHSQQIKQQLKNGEIIVRNYHYPGVLDQIPHIKLGKSVLAVPPGSEDEIINLLRSFNEVIFYTFTGWLPTSLWPMKYDEDIDMTSKLIINYGYLSVLFQIQKKGGSINQSDLSNAGFSLEYSGRAINYLLNKDYLQKNQDELIITATGKHIIDQVS